ncbi:MAG: hypothetical protein JW750_03550 [Anaerolineaceae bacterium]|nr:hypothetical protein [Anaerolineaceae bacterium]
MSLTDWSTWATFLLIASSLLLLLSENWRIYLTSLAVQYLAVFALVTLSWPIGLAAVKLVAGWMAAAVLGASQPAADLRYRFSKGNAGLIFRFLTAVEVWLLVFSISPKLAEWLPVDSMILFQGLLLIGMGLLQLAMSVNRVRSIVGLLTFFSGFELIFAALESSVLVAGLLAMTQLGLAIAGGYLMSLPGEETAG